MKNQEIVLSDTTTDTENRYSNDKCSDIGIYGLKNKFNGKWYIGQTKNSIQRRWGQYKRLDCKNQPKLLRALKKYGYDGFEKINLEICPPNREVLNSREDYWITEKNSIKGGYNIRTGGFSGKFNSETRAKMSASHRGKKFTKEHRKKLSDSARRRPRWSHTSEARIKMSNFQRGRNVGKNNGNYGKFWITNGVDAKLVSPTSIIPTAWSVGGKPCSDIVKKKLSTAMSGRVLSQERVKKIRARMLTNNHFKGKTHSEDTKRIIGEKARLRYLNKS